MRRNLNCQLGNGYNSVSELRNWPVTPFGVPRSFIGRCGLHLDTPPKRSYHQGLSLSDTAGPGTLGRGQPPTQRFLTGKGFWECLRLSPALITPPPARAGI